MLKQTELLHSRTCEFLGTFTMVIKIVDLCTIFYREAYHQSSFKQVFEYRGMDTWCWMYAYSIYIFWV